MFRNLMEEKLVPRQWKRANVMSIFKKYGENALNYRPVSMTSTICKTGKNNQKANGKAFIKENYPRGNMSLEKRSCIMNLPG